MKQNFTVRQGALDGVEASLSVARHRSFRKAAAELGVTPSAISQAVRTLETRVGVALFIRTTRNVGLTEAGQRFFLRAAPAFDELVGAGEDARELGKRPAGLLRIAVPPAVIPVTLEALIASFCRAYPDVELEIAASNELVDLATGGFDAGIRLGQFIAPDMVVVPLSSPFPFVVVGSPEYLELAQTTGADWRFAGSCMPAHTSLQWSHCAVGLCRRWPEGGDGRFRAADRARLSYVARRGNPGRWACSGAWTHRQGNGCRWTVTSIIDALCAHDVGGFSLSSGTAPGVAQASGVH
jgi:DNA-binding transcriptional LysR family regulator